MDSADGRLQPLSEADGRGAVDTVSGKPGGINSGRRALVVPIHGSAQPALLLQSPTSPARRHLFPLSPTLTNSPLPPAVDAYTDHALRIDSGATRSGNLTIKGSHRRPAPRSDSMTTLTGPGARQLEAAPEEAHRPLAASSQTVHTAAAAADHGKAPSASGSTSSLLSLYQQTEEGPAEALVRESATADSTTTAGLDNPGNVRGAGARAVDTQHSAS
ncbi:hypothetical protein GGF43_006558, partial [Coemansia sp. RSA 2618]